MVRVIRFIVNVDIVHAIGNHNKTHDGAHDNKHRYANFYNHRYANFYNHLYINNADLRKHNLAITSIDYFNPSLWCPRDEIHRRRQSFHSIWDGKVIRYNVKWYCVKWFNI